ncbi:MAG: hypothetical protein ABSG52_16625 [Terriglobales bacterium]|jgi:hypothetical protein
MLDPESEQIREVYALFGLAMYLAQNLERGLAMLLAVFGEAKLMTAWDYDARLAENFQSTFGALVTKFAELAGSEHVKLTDQLAKAVDDRNDLAHHYFWGRAIKFCSSDGGDKMITELHQMRHEFESLDEELTELTRECVKRRGLSAEVLEACTAAHMEELRTGVMEPYNPERVPNPIEIVAAYEWRVESTVKSKLVLASKDGRYLILGEKGLCYGPRNISAQELVVKAHFERALPAKVNPRPKTSAPWNLAIPLANGHILRARPEEIDGKPMVRFGLHRLRP